MTPREFLNIAVRPNLADAAARPGDVRLALNAVHAVDVYMDHSIAMHLLFDPGHSLDERILREQFGY